ncbi:MAG: tRNA pseudouridine(55) synthase TruB [Anaerolineales bacterium]|jgi:tRNA pseudouridine55 synthase
MKDFGLLVVDKPVGPTSHFVVQVVRRGTRVRKVGHAGTLDPRASGVLVLCLGAATRLSEYLSTSEKRYEAVIRFGASTKTYDTEGEIVRHTGIAPSLDEIEDVLPRFKGDIQQVPPPFSAIKVKGRKAYEIAREGQNVDLAPRVVTIFDLETVSYDPPDLTLGVLSSAGTYIRSLAHDIGEMLSTGAHLAALRRTKAGPFSLEDTLPLAKLEASFVTGTWEQFVLPAKDAIPDFPIVDVTTDQMSSIRNGHRIPAPKGSEGLARAIGPDGELAAILEFVEDGEMWHPRKVFVR